ncbi:hypothetical protein I6M59_10350 [Shewanella algae]|uniref:hypothetical protein n=1 Tax=Shewanella algae TaxID=38313 RepID=UPI001AAE8343|nr:hypothetical protein [Shewanella algae]MBO2692144.1 hypothetical protein [Shewanella algae]
MKAISLPKQLPQVLTNALIAVAAIYGIYTLTKGFRVANQLAATATEPLANMISDVTATVNGWEPVQATQAGFVLNSKYVAADGSINTTWRSGIEAMHEGNKALFNRITYAGRLKPEYYWLRDGVVNASTV